MKPKGTLKYKLQLIKGLFFELTDAWENKEYKIIIGEKVNEIKLNLYDAIIPVGGWVKLNREYMCDYFVDIYDADELKETIWIKDYIKNKRVFISFDSVALGDHIAWLPYCREFKNYYQCHVIVSTFKNYLFQNTYKDLEFVERGIVVNNIVAHFEFGWFWNKDKEPINPVTIPLQQSACNILGLPYKEIKADVNYRIGERPTIQHYVVISVHSTSGLKYWQDEEWQKVIDFLHGKGYKVYEISSEKTQFNNAEDIPDTSMESTMNFIHHAEFFIGLSSGLSWLAWAMGKHVFMIANFSKDGHEFTSDCTRITNTDVCHGCWNNPMFKFNRGDWYYCPEHEDTPRHFECHRGINAEKVIYSIGTYYNI